MPSASDTQDSGVKGRPAETAAVFSPRGLHGAPMPRGVSAHGAPRKELDRAVDQMLAQSGGEKPAAPAPAPAPKEIQNLDQQLAQAADDLMAGEVAPEALAPAAPAPAGTAPPSAPASEAAAPPTGAAPAAAEEPVLDEEEKRQMELAQSAVRPQPAQPPQPAAPAKPVQATAPAAPAKPVQAAAPAAAAQPAQPHRAQPTVLPPPAANPPAAPQAAPAGGTGRSRPVPALVQAILARLSSPLKNQPQYIRDTVGWVALVHIFMAACVWVYIVAIRSPVAAEPSAVVTPAAAETPEHGAPAKAAHKTPVKRSTPKNAPRDSHASPVH